MDTSNKYLSVGSHIAKKYEIVDVLGEDEFEILYLVRSLHRKGSFFVLKELYLETFSFREDTSVSTVPEAMGVFYKRKKQIIEEVEYQRLNLHLGEIKIYGYEEYNNTIYTIMEFSNNASLEKYLQFIPKDSKHLPSLSELVEQDNKTINYFFFLKIFLIIGIMAIISFFIYEYFQKDSMKKNSSKLEKPTSVSTPWLKDRTGVMEVNETVKEKKTIIEKHKLPVSMMVNLPIIKEFEQNTTIVNKVVETNITIISDPTLKEVNNTVSLYLQIKFFLDDYMSASSISSINDTLRYYDTKVIKYFKLRNVTHPVISKKQEEYNKKWLKRDFKIVDFEILKTYENKKINFYDLKTITTWNVSNSKAKKASGESIGFMTLKKMENTFKITSIYTFK